MPLVRTTSGKSFQARDGETLLNAALRADVTLPYSCRTGRCSTCKFRTVSGSSLALQAEIGLTPAEQRDGWALSCVRQALTDVDIDVEDLSDLRLSTPRTLPCRIQAIEPLSPDVVRVLLRLPPTADFIYRSGQYIDVIGLGGLRRSYSIANAPSADRLLELQIRRVRDGVMSGYWFDKAQVNDLLRLHGPLGTFVLRQADDLDLIFLATGTGIAPIKALLQGLATDGGYSGRGPRSTCVVWGGRTPADLYWDTHVPGSSHKFVPVLSRADPAWGGERGYVQQAILRRKRDWSRTAVYACGSDLMIDAARAELLAAGLDEKRFFSDAFVSSSSMQRLSQGTS